MTNYHKFCTLKLEQANFVTVSVSQEESAHSFTDSSAEGLTRLQSKPQVFISFEMRLNFTSSFF